METRLCRECNKDTELSWRDDKTPYWKHIKRNIHCTMDYAQSSLHKMVKDFLINYISLGGQIEFMYNCHYCKSFLTPSLLCDSEISCQEDIPYVNLIDEKHYFDIAGVNKEGQIVFGIDILHKFKSENSIANMGIPWFEIHIGDVLDQIDTANNILTLRHYRNVTACSSDICKWRTGNGLGYLNRRSVYGSPARRILDEAVLGASKPDILEWNTRGHRDIKRCSELWDFFLACQVCIRCDVFCKTRIGRPFCSKCYIEVFNYTPIGISQRIPSDNKNYYLEKLKWLSDVPGEWKRGSPCFFCKRKYRTKEENRKFSSFWEYGTHYVNSRVFWDGSYRKCCTVCLDQRLRKDGLIE